MAPLLEADASAYEAQAAQDLAKQKFAAKKSLLASQALRFPVAAESEDLALQAESFLDPEQQFGSQLHRDRIAAGIGRPVDTPSFSTNWDLTEEDEQTLEDFDNEEAEIQQASRADFENYTLAKAQSAEKRLRNDVARKIASSDNDKLMQEIINTVPGLLGDVDTPMEDGGITLGGSAATALYQEVLTQIGNADALKSVPFSEYIPKGYSKSILGWVARINGFFVMLWASGPGFLLLVIPVIIVLIIIGVTTSLIPGF